MDNIVRDTSKRIVRQSTGFATIMLSFALIFSLTILSCVILYIDAQRKVLSEKLDQIKIVSQILAQEYEPAGIIVEMCEKTEETDRDS